MRTLLLLCLFGGLSQLAVAQNHITPDTIYNTVWSNVNAGQYGTMRVATNRLWLQTSGTYYLSDPEGLNWANNSDPITGNPNSFTLKRHWRGKTLGFKGNTTYRSADDGSTWNVVSDPQNAIPYTGTVRATHSDDRVVIYNYNRLAHSSDEGITWKGIDNPTDIQSSNFVSRQDTFLFFQAPVGGQATSKRFISYDAGQSWQSNLMPVALPEWLVGNYAHNSVAAFTGNTGFLKTKDYGTSWAYTNPDLLPPNAPDSNGSDSRPVRLAGKDSDFTAVIAGGGLWLTHDDGAHWAVIDALPFTEVVSTNTGNYTVAYTKQVRLLNDYLFINDHAGNIWRADAAGILRELPGSETFVNTTDISDDRDRLVLTAVRVSPNPAADVLQVQFDVRQSTTFRLTLTDQLGRTLRTLEAKQDWAVGTHRARYDLSALAAGQYYLRIDGDGIQNALPVLVQR